MNTDTTLLPAVCPSLQALQERAALGEEWAKQDWRKNFAHRISYDEYRFIGDINAQVLAGTMDPSRAQECVAAYRETHEKSNSLPCHNPTSNHP